MTHYNLVHKLILRPQAMKIPDTKAAVDKEWKKLETMPACNWRKSRARRKLFSKHKETKKKSTLQHVWTYATSKTRILNQKYKGRVVHRGDTVKTTLEPTQFFFTEQGSSASQMTEAKIMVVVARLQDCDGQAADAGSACFQVKLEDAPKSECPHGYVFHGTNVGKPGQTLKILLYLSNEMYMDILWRDCHGKDKSRKFNWNLDRKKIPNEECLFVHRNKDCSYRYTWMT